MHDTVETSGRFRLNVLPKLLLFIVLSCNVFLIDSLAALGLILAGLALLLTLLPVRLGYFKWLLLAALAGVPFTAAVFWVAAWEQTGNWLTALPLALRDGGRFIFRIKIIVLANILVVRTTSLRELTTCLRSLRVPEPAVLFLSTIVRFLPLSCSECRRILEAQRCRGFRLRGLMNPQNLLPLLVPLLLSHMRLSHEMALNLEIRHFAWQAPQQRQPALRGIGDWCACALAGALFIMPYFAY